MSVLKNLQYFIHKNYEIIKLGLLAILIFLGIVTLVSVSASDARRTEYESKQSKLRDSQLAEQNQHISQSIKDQHDAQDRRVACFFNLFVDYTNYRKPITAEDVDRCGIVPAPEAPVLRSPSTTPIPSTPVPDAPGKSDGKRNN